MTYFHFKRQLKTKTWNEITNIKSWSSRNFPKTVTRGVLYITGSFSISFDIFFSIILQINSRIL